MSAPANLPEEVLLRLRRVRVLQQALAIQLDAAGPADGRPTQFVDVFPRTPDGKVRLFPEELEGQSAIGLYRFRGRRLVQFLLLAPVIVPGLAVTLGIQVFKAHIF